MFVGVGVRKQGASFMEKQPANVYWLQNNNNTPQRQQNQLRPNPGGRPNRQPPQRSKSPRNRWLRAIVVLMLGIFLYHFFHTNSYSGPPTHSRSDSPHI